MNSILSLRKSVLFVSLFIASSYIYAQQKLIHYWHFNTLANYTTVPVSPASFPIVRANYSSLDLNKVFLAYKPLAGTIGNAATYWDNVNPGDTTNQRMGQPAGLGFRPRNPSDSMQLVLYIPSTGYQNIVLKMAVQKSSAGNGAAVNLYDYSIDSGLTWKTSGMSVLIDSNGIGAWKYVTTAITNDTLAKNNPALAIRIRFSGPGNTGTSGNIRLDNITIEGDTFVAPNPSFSAGRLVVVHTTGTISKGGSPVVLREFSTDGTPGFVDSIPVTGSTPLQMAAGSGGSEGFLTRSTDGTFLVLGGYQTSTIGIPDITVTPASTTPRMLVKVNPSGILTKLGSSTVSYSGNDIRGGISDGTNYWASGASNTGVDGINYFGPDSPAALAINAKAYGLQVFNGQIYFSTQKTAAGVTPNFGIYALGTGMPKSGTITPTLIINTGTATPEDFSINPSDDICYIAINMNSAIGGIQKWVKTSGNWNLAYTLGTGAANIGAYGLVVDYSGVFPVLFATTFESTGNRIIKITDSSSTAVATTLTTAPAGSWFHGIAFTPACQLPAQPAAFTSGNSVVKLGQNGVIYTVPNTANYTYTWNYSGKGATIHGTGNSVTIDFSQSATSGTLSVKANNGCSSSLPRSMTIQMDGAMRITEYMYDGADSAGTGEFIEFTNIGNKEVDMTGWSFDDSTRVKGSTDLSAFGKVQPGQSVILTDLSSTAFHSRWSLCAPLKVIGNNTNTLDREDEINLYDSTGALIDRLTYGDLIFAPGSLKTLGKSGWVDTAGIGVNSLSAWHLSASADTESSVLSTKSEIGSPGKSTHAPVSFDPCYVANFSPVITLLVDSTSNYLDGGISSSPAGPYGISAVLNDPSDPSAKYGFVFNIKDAETRSDSLSITLLSSNTAVVPLSNIILSGTDSIRKIKIIPASVGYSNITLKVSDGTNTTSYIIFFAASQGSTTPAATIWHTGMSDASDAIALDSNYYITGDDELNVLNVYSRHSSGLPLVSYEYTSGLALPEPSKPEVDLEAATISPMNPNKIYWIGSMSNGKAPFDAKPNRNRIFATTVSGTGAQTSFSFGGYYGNLRTRLLAWGDSLGYNFSASAAVGVDSKTPAGFAAEGMTFGPDNTTLYIGLRAPLVPTANRTKAVIAPILNFESWFNNGSPSGNPQFGSPIELNLGGRGIRDLVKLSNGTYMIVAGSPGTDTTTALYKWSGLASDSAIMVYNAQPSLNLEGAMQQIVNGKPSLTQLQVISDGGDVILYNDGAEAKDQNDTKLRKFRSDLITTSGFCFPTKRDTAAVACNSFTWYGTTYTTSGKPTRILTNAQGCDSVITLTLTIKNSSTSNSTQTVCDSLVWNRTTYTISGVYVKHFVNADGCDSAATLNLTVNHSSKVTVEKHACDSLVWNGTTYTTSGVYVKHFVNANGCDSAATLNLTVNHGSEVIVEKHACDSIVWNGITYKTSGSYTFHLQRSTGCDSLLTLSLIIDSVTTPFITQTGDQLSSSMPNGNQWYFNSTILAGETNQTLTPSADGPYYVIVTEASGCSSLPSNSINFIHTGIAFTAPSNSSFYAFPNPFNSGLNIVYKLDKKTEATIELFDINGTRIGMIANKEQADAGEHTYVLTKEQFNLKTGIYLIRLSTPTANKNIKVNFIE